MNDNKQEKSAKIINKNVRKFLAQRKFINLQNINSAAKIIQSKAKNYLKIKKEQRLLLANQEINKRKKEQEKLNDTKWEE